MYSERAEIRGPGVTEADRPNHTSRVWTRRLVEQIRLTLGHSNQGVPYPCVINSKCINFPFSQWKFN